MTFLAKWFDYLTKNGVRYSHSVHRAAQTARQTAQAEFVPAHEFAKTVTFFSERGFGAAVVPADECVDLMEAARRLNLAYIRLANEQELSELFPDCEVGAMPPINMRYEMPVIVDEAVADNPYIAFTVGTHRDAVRMKYEDFRRLAKPVSGEIAIHKLAHA